jgi:peptidoglycan/LPS O-acetylase OafA/YrhL
MSAAKFKYIDLTRGIAVILVVMVHLGQSIPNIPPLVFLFSKFGQFGVQLFFAASALTLCMSANKIKWKNGDIASFWIRRFFRIWPMYTVGIFIYASIFILKQWRTWPLLLDQPYSFENIFSNVMLVHAFFPLANNNIVPGGWSIATEVLFYICFPWLWIGLFRRGAAFGSVREIVIKLIGIQIFSCCLCIGQKYLFSMDLENNKYLYYSLPFQMVAFNAGFFAWALSAKTISMSWRVSSVYIMLSIIIGLFFSFIEGNYLYLQFSIVASSCFVLIHTMSSSSSSSMPNILVELGKKSYSLYVLHFVVATYLVRYIYNNIPGIPVNWFSFFLLLPIVVYLSYLLSSVAWKFIEDPGIRFGKFLINRLNLQ